MHSNQYKVLVYVCSVVYCVGGGIGWLFHWWECFVRLFTLSLLYMYIHTSGTIIYMYSQFVTILALQNFRNVFLPCITVLHFFSFPHKCSVVCYGLCPEPSIWQFLLPPPLSSSVHRHTCFVMTRLTDSSRELLKWRRENWWWMVWPS